MRCWGVFVEVEVTLPVGIGIGVIFGIAVAVGFSVAQSNHLTLITSQGNASKRPLISAVGCLRKLSTMS
jgi:hypothetical protein